MAYLVPYTINSRAYKHAQRPLSLAHEGYVRVEAKTPAEAVSRTHRLIKLEHKVEVQKIIEA